MVARTAAALSWAPRKASPVTAAAVRPRPVPATAAA